MLGAQPGPLLSRPFSSPTLPEAALLSRAPQIDSGFDAYSLAPAQKESKSMRGEKIDKNHSGNALQDHRAMRW